jgi:prepilin-type N-terminal cleavage/methylation domain-containing protein/prepilin-type processing-associated H-X9-DG protein
MRAPGNPGAALRFGFTLIEILVVVAIIALLTAILLPSLSRARDQARRAVCASNLHQQMLAMGFYSSDYKGYGPWRGYFTYDLSEEAGEAYGRPAPFQDRGKKVLVNWGLLVGGKATNGSSGKMRFKYMKGWDALYCPSTMTFWRYYPRGLTAGGLDTLWDVAISFTYGGYNYALPMANRAGAPPLDMKIYPRQAARLEDNFVVVMMEKAKARGMTNRTFTAPLSTADEAEADKMLPKVMPISVQPIFTDRLTGGGPKPHGEGSNVAYSDGHVKFWKLLPGQSGGTSTSYVSFQWWDYITINK